MLQDMGQNGLWKVVVVDDEPEFRGWVRSLLEGSGEFCVVGEAGTGSEAVSLIPSLNPDLVIADMYIPEPDGLELVRLVQESYPEVKAILISAHEDRVYRRLAREAGALTFIPKVSFSMAAVRQALQGEG